MSHMMPSASKNPSLRYYYIQKGTQTLFFSYNSNHPIQIKVKFFVGHLKVFYNQHFFTSEIYSDTHLAPHLEWNDKYFEALIQGLKQFNLIESEDQNDSSIGFQIKAKLSQQQPEQIILKTKLVQQFGSNINNQLWNCFNLYNQDKKKQTQINKNKKIQLAKEKQSIIDSMTNMQINYQNQIQTLKGQLSVLFKQKVQKLRELGEEYMFPQIQNAIDNQKKNDIFNRSTYHTTYQTSLQFPTILGQFQQNTQKLYQNK